MELETLILANQDVQWSISAEVHPQLKRKSEKEKQMKIAKCSETKEKKTNQRGSKEEVDK